MIKSHKYEETSWIKERYREIGPSILFFSFATFLLIGFGLYISVFKELAYVFKESGPVGQSYAENHGTAFHKLGKAEANKLPDEFRKILDEFDDYYVSALTLEPSNDSPNVSEITIYSTSKSLTLRYRNMLHYKDALSEHFESISASYQIGYKPKKRLARMGENLSMEKLYSIAEEPERLFHIQRQARSFILYDIKLAPSYNDAVDGNALRETLVTLGTHIFCEISEGHFDLPPSSKPFSSTLIAGTSKTACRLVDEGH